MTIPLQARGKRSATFSPAASCRWTITANVALFCGKRWAHSTLIVSVRACSYISACPLLLHSVGTHACVLTVDFNAHKKRAVLWDALRDLPAEARRRILGLVSGRCNHLREAVLSTFLRPCKLLGYASENLDRRVEASLRGLWSAPRKHVKPLK
jgi:hypothetical protein